MLESALVNRSNYLIYLKTTWGFNLELTDKQVGMLKRKVITYIFMYWTNLGYDIRSVESTN